MSSTAQQLPLIAIFGPTSSGKTALSIGLGLLLERRLGIEPVIISADSRQVYRHMDIGTSKTTVEEMHGIQHEMIDITDPVRKLELEEYSNLARKLIMTHQEAARLPIIVGGTGTYVASLLHGWEVAGTASVRAALEQDFPRSMTIDAYETLRRLDKIRADRIHPNNHDAVLNALVAVMVGVNSSPTLSGNRTLVLGVDRSPAELDRRVTRTFDRQIDRGLLEEINALTERYRLDEELRLRGTESRNQVLHTHGYREFFEVSSRQGKMVAELTEADLNIARNLVLEHIWAHTRRQRGWFAKLPNVHQVRNVEQAFKLITDALRKFRVTQTPPKRTQRRQQKN